MGDQFSLPLMWIVELEEGCWFAPWSGDPGRTLLRESAKQYRSEYAAHCALMRAKRLFTSRDFSRAKVVSNASLSGAEGVRQWSDDGHH